MTSMSIWSWKGLSEENQCKPNEENQTYVVIDQRIDDEGIIEIQDRDNVGPNKEQKHNQRPEVTSVDDNYTNRESHKMIT